MIKFIQRTKNDNRIRLKGESWTEDYIGVDLYFDITAEEPTTIIGGGLFNDTTIKNAIIENNRTILWGTGSSDNLHRYDASVKVTDSFIHNVKKDKIKAVKNILLDFGMRDKYLIDDLKHYLPCASCFNYKFITEPQGDKRLWVINSRDYPRAPDDEDQIFLNTPEETVLEKWNRAETIVTNSYHTLYWALLSGRKVIPITYGTKFLYLFDMFDIQLKDFNFYKRPKIPFSIPGTNDCDVIRYLNMKTYEANSSYLSLFQEKNLAFAERLKNVGVTAIRRKI